jgi:hypothetical protein
MDAIIASVFMEWGLFRVTQEFVRARQAEFRLAGARIDTLDDHVNLLRLRSENIRPFLVDRFAKEFLSNGQTVIPYHYVAVVGSGSFYQMTFCY